MDRSIEVLEAGISEAKLGDREKLDALGRLRKLVPSDIRS
jgi:hypothetical protein